MNTPHPAGPAPASSPIPTLTLPTGTPIPVLGFGTYKVAPEDAYDAVSRALEVGYRHIDTAQMYGNEAGVGRALAASGIDRDELFVTSKLDNGNHGHDDALRSLDRSLTELGLDRLDLFLVHWPMAAVTNIVETWRTMIEILQSGRVRAIGVSNHQAEHLREITDATGIAPAVNQIELHPYLAQEPLRIVHRSLGIVTESWSPLGRGRLLKDPVVVDIAAALGLAPAQVVIRWHLQHGLVVIPKTTHVERMHVNADVFSFTLSDEQMAALDALDRNLRTGSHPDTVQRQM